MTALEVLQKAFREKREQLADALSSGRAVDYAEYRAICGEIQGLLFAEREVTDLAHKLENSDE